MSDRDSFSIPEVALCGLAVAATISSAVYAAKLLHDGDYFHAMEAGGIAMVALAAIFDPLNIIADTVTFPFRLLDPSGRATRFTAVTSFLGCAVAIAGWALSLWAT